MITRSGQFSVRKFITESEAKPIRVVRVVVVVGITAGVHIHEVVRIVEIGIALPPVVG